MFPFVRELGGTRVSLLIGMQLQQPFGGQGISQVLRTDNGIQFNLALAYWLEHKISISPLPARQWLHRKPSEAGEQNLGESGKGKGWYTSSSALPAVYTCLQQVTSTGRTVAEAASVLQHAS